MRVKRILFILALTTAGCATVERSYWVRAWEPAVQVNIVRVHAIAAYCPPGAVACAKLFTSGVCNVYTPAHASGGYTSHEALEHELCHCLGYDHPRAGASVACPVDVRAADPLISHRIASQ